VLATYSSGGQDLFGMPRDPHKRSAQVRRLKRRLHPYQRPRGHRQRPGGNSVSVVFKGAASQTKTVTAKVVGVDQTSDVALLKIDPAAPASLIRSSSETQARCRSVSRRRYRQPLGFDFSLTEASSQRPTATCSRRTVRPSPTASRPTRPSTKATLAAPHRLVRQGDRHQRADRLAVRGNQGLGFAVPIDTAKNAMTQLEQTGTVKYAWLGIAGQTITPDVAKTLNLKAAQGVLVAQVTPAALQPRRASPAARLRSCSRTSSG